MQQRHELETESIVQQYSDVSYHSYGADPGFFAGGGRGVNDGRVQRRRGRQSPFFVFAIVKKFVEKKIGGREQGGGSRPPPPGSAPAVLIAIQT